MTIDQAMESVARRVLNTRIIFNDSRGSVQDLIRKYAAAEGLTMGEHLAGIRSKFTEIEQQYQEGCRMQNAMMKMLGKREQEG